MVRVTRIALLLGSDEPVFAQENLKTLENLKTQEKLGT